MKTWEYTASGGRAAVVRNGTEAEASQLLALMNNAASVITHSPPSKITPHHPKGSWL